MLDLNKINISNFAGFCLPSIDSRRNNAGQIFESKSKLEREQRELCLDAERLFIDLAEHPFNSDQRAVFLTVWNLVESENVFQNARFHLKDNFFLDDPCGTDKTFNFNALLQAVR